MGTVGDCSKCSLSAVPVPMEIVGRRSGKGKVLFIGEAPGEQEEITGRPFVGQSGSILRWWLKNSGMKNYAITNAVACRPPNNRSPHAKERRACYNRLLEEVRQYRPRYIVCLGSTATRAIAGTDRANLALYRRQQSWKIMLSALLGMPASSDYEIKVMATWHPAYVLRSGGVKSEIGAEWLEDLNRLVTDTWTEPETVEVVEGPGKLLAAERKLLAWDLETTGLDPLDEEVLCLGLSHLVGKAEVVDLVKNPAALPRLLEKMREGRPVVGHNIKFDLRWLLTECCEEARVLYNADYHDTMLMQYLLDEREPRGLDEMISKHTGLGDYTSIFDVHTSNMKASWRDNREGVIQYCGTDAAATLRLYTPLMRQLQKENLTRLYSMKKKVMLPLLDMELTGMPVDNKMLDCVDSILTGRIGVTLQQVSRLLEREVTERDLNSNPWLSKVLYEERGLPVLKRTATKLPAVDREALESLQEQNPDPLLELLMNYRRDHKLHSTYVVALREKQHEGRVHTTYAQTTAASSRLASSNPNLQNIPRGPLIRSIIEAPTGYEIVSVDYSQIELRIAAIVSKDRAMCELFREGRDLHTETACKIFDTTTPSKEQRTSAKIINFGVLYGMGPGTLAKAADMTFHDARVYISRWYDAYPGIATWVQDTTQELKETGCTTSMWGARRFLNLAWAKTTEQVQGMVRQAVNHPIQSAASDLTCMAAYQVWRLLPDGCRMIGIIHDQILLEVPRKKGVLDVAQHVVRVMTDVEAIQHLFGYRVNFRDVPITADASHGKSWGKQKEIPNAC